MIDKITMFLVNKQIFLCRPSARYLYIREIKMLIYKYMYMCGVNLWKSFAATEKCCNFAPPLRDSGIIQTYKTL